MNPKIKANQEITIHRDNTVSYFSIYRQVWTRISVFEIVNRHDDFAALTQSDRDQISRAHARRLKG
jgi:hypothetical protein